jgi:hypothetical protein
VCSSLLSRRLLLLFARCRTSGINDLIDKVGRCLCLGDLYSTAILAWLIIDSTTRLDEGLHLVIAV